MEWKYLVETLENSGLNDSLDKRGSDGWELVTLLPVPAASAKLLAVYKRRIQRPNFKEPVLSKL